MRAGALALLVVSACGVEGGGAGAAGDPHARVSSPIIAGSDSTADQDAVVMIKHYDAVKIGGGAEGCTGTMLAPRLVLTARHCVAATDPQLACEPDGSASFGGVVRESYLASKLFAFSGVARPDFISGLDRAARGAEIIDDQAKNLCNHDLALILLERPLPGAKIAPVRLEGGPKVGEVTTIVGWGVTDKEASPSVRKQRANVKVLEVGPAAGIGPSEFRVGEGGCAGDSGGPAFAASGAIVGVLSRGGNGKDPNPEVPGVQCIGGENVFTSVSGFRDLVLSAYAKAGQDPWNEGAPDPRTVPKAEPSPAAEASDDGGCGVVRHRGEGTTALLAAAALVACVRRRRTRSSRA
ncbi:MAG: trypsin-like serine protease [Deltaproteobacteria bacterium]|nr:trypsin-like serine protease [Deltaproteobacteria bacterium]